MSKAIGVVFFLLWIYVLHVLQRSKLPAWKYIWGSGGMFILLLFFLQPIVTMPLAKLVAALAGIVGDLGGAFSAYFKYGVIFVESAAGSISLSIDFECSGVIEIFAFVSLLFFFEAYTRYERVIVGVLGVLFIILANTIRIIAICYTIHFFGTSAYYVAHTFLGRVLFYGLSILLYFYVFTRTQIIRQKVGGFSYGNH